MKKRFSMIAAVAGALLFGVTSCNKQAEEPTGQGSLKINFDFASEDSDNGESKAAVSNAIPTTGWKNIKNLQLVLTRAGASRVAYVQTLPVPPASAAATSDVVVVSQLPTGAYDIYVIANNGASGNPMDPNAGGSATEGLIDVGDDINDKVVKLAAAPSSPESSMVENDIYLAPSELFMGKSPNATIDPDRVTNIGTVSLTRIVGLVRVVINKKHDNVKDVDFTHEKAYLRIRRHAVAWSLGGEESIWHTLGRAKATLVADRPFSSSTTGGEAYPSTGNNVMLTGDFTQWMDVMCLPGGSAATGNEKFNIVIYGWAPQGYKLATGATLSAPGLVYWEGAVNAPLTSNNILEIQATITTPGKPSDGVNPPDVTDYGDLEFSFSLTNWGVISDTVLPL